MDLLPPSNSWQLSDVTTFQLEELDAVPLLALLGQLGGGKTTEIKAAMARLQAAGARVEYLDLTGVDSGSHLRTILSESEELDAWRRGESLFLFIDGLDRRLVDMVVVQQELGRAMRADAEAASRLRVRIACRTADWEGAVGDQLSQTWPEQTGDIPRFIELELLGLSEDDVREAAASIEMDADLLIEEINTQAARAIAASPITFNMLIESLHSTGRIEDRAALYRRAVKRLVSEHHPTRALAEEFAPPEELLAMASRIAAAMLLGQAPSVATDPENSENSMLVSELLGGSEREFGGPLHVPVERTTLRQVLHTGLMRVDGSGRATFVHQSYAEYLCAAWLMSGAVVPDQVAGLLINPHDPHRRLVAHLRDVAAWLAILAPENFSLLIGAQAEVLLRGDVSALDSDSRKALVLALLRDVERDRIVQWDHRVRDNIRKLRFDGIEDVLARLIEDPTAPTETRGFAAELAEANHVVETVDSLVTLALASDESAYLRSKAVQVVGTLGKPEDRRLLIPLALEEQRTDSDDEIKAAALRVAWPALITADQLLGALTPPKYRRLIGSYRMFLRDAPRALDSADLSTALTWVKALGNDERTAGLDTFIDGVMCQASQEVTRPDVRTAMADVCVDRIREYQDLLSDRGACGDVGFLADHDQRRLLLTEVVQRYSADMQSAWIVQARPALIRTDDVPWLCAQVLAAGNESASVWLDLLWVMFRPETSDPTPVFNVCETHREARERLDFWFGSVELDSDSAQAGREATHAAASEPSDGRASVAPTDMDAVLREQLREVEMGNVMAWWSLDYNLSWARSGIGRETDDIEPDLRNTPGWKRAPAEFRARLVEGAIQYVREGDPQAEDWFEDGKGWKPAFAANRALALIETEQPAEFRALGAQVWGRWAPALVAFPRASWPETDLHDRVLRRAVTSAPEALKRWVLARVVGDDGRDADLAWISTFLKLLRDTDLAVELFRFAESEEVTARGRETLLESLLEADPANAAATAGLLFERVRRSPDVSQDVVAALGALLLRRVPRDAWAHVWDAMRQDEALARRTIDQVAEHESLTVVSDCSPEQITDFYLLVEEIYPIESDPPLRDGAVTGDQHRVIWRQRFLSLLAQQGTLEGLTALRAITARMPPWDYFRRLIRDAEVLLAERLWRSPSPKELIALTLSNDRRYVQSAEELGTTVVASLGRAQNKLQEGWPAAWQLWNDAPRTPKSEERLSDWIKAWLDDDLQERVVATREPQVRPSRTGSGIGPRNDLRVEIPAGNGTPAVAIIVEVKRCWHPKVFTAMRTQLADDYLKSAGLTHGVYVVGFYDAPDWSDRGSRTARRHTPLAWNGRLRIKADEVLAETGKTIATVVLDISLRSDRASA